jgi:hypothetical protein
MVYAMNVMTFVSCIFAILTAGCAVGNHYGGIGYGTVIVTNPEQYQAWLIPKYYTNRSEKDDEKENISGEGGHNIVQRTYDLYVVCGSDWKKDRSITVGSKKVYIEVGKCTSSVMY